MTRIEWLACCVMVGLTLLAASGACADEDTSMEQSRLVAEGAAEAADASDSCKCAGEAGSEAVAKIEAALRSPLRATGLEFMETPLEEVANLLQEEYGIPVQIDVPALEEIGLDAAEPVTVSLHNISLRSALRLMLHRLNLTYIIANEVLMITSPEEAEHHLVNCVYDVSGLIDESNFDPLIDAVTTCVATDTWSDNGGGNADIRPLKPGLLVISQSQAVHEEIAELLKAIQEMRKHVTADKSAD